MEKHQPCWDTNSDAFDEDGNELPCVLAEAELSPEVTIHMDERGNRWITHGVFH